MRYYLGTCEYKWTHAHTSMEQIWVRRELGDELYRTIESNNWKWTLLRSDSQSLPADIYCRCDVYVDIDNTKHATLFALKYTEAVPVASTSTDTV